MNGETFLSDQNKNKKKKTSSARHVSVSKIVPKASDVLYRQIFPCDQWEKIAQDNSETLLTPTL